MGGTAVLLQFVTQAFAKGLKEEDLQIRLMRFMPGRQERTLRETYEAVSTIIHLKERELAMERECDNTGLG